MNIENVNLYLKSTLAKTVFDIDDEKIKGVEKLVRNSLEYKKVIADKRGNDNENSCELFTDYDFNDKHLTLELHHVITLYDICNAVYKQLLTENTKDFVSTLEVANKVMEYHYKNAFLYVFLSKTAHQLVHNGQYEVPLKDIKGNASLIKETYFKYLDEPSQTIVEDILNA